MTKKSDPRDVGIDRPQFASPYVAREICLLMHACHGDDSQPAIWADETVAALQRLKWELERVRQKEHAAAG